MPFAVHPCVHHPVVKLEPSAPSAPFVPFAPIWPIVLAVPVPPVVAAGTPLQLQLQKVLMQTLEQMTEDEAVDILELV